MMIERSGGGLNSLPVAESEITTHFSTLGLGDDTIATLTPYIFAATREIEDYTGLAIITHTVTLRDVQFSPPKPSAWWSGVRQGIPEDVGSCANTAVFLAIRPAISLISVVDSTTGENLELSSFRLHGRVDAQLIPIGSVPRNPVDVTYFAGYGNLAAEVPSDLRLAILDHALRLYERRGDEIGTPLSLSAAASRIAARYKRVHL